MFKLNLTIINLKVINYEVNYKTFLKNVNYKNTIVIIYFYAPSFNYLHFLTIDYSPEIWVITFPILQYSLFSSDTLFGKIKPEKA